MCRYFSGFFHHHPLLADFDYYWRIEPDVHYYCNLDYDPFLFMKQKCAARLKHGILALEAVGASCHAGFSPLGLHYSASLCPKPSVMAAEHSTAPGTAVLAEHCSARNPTSGPPRDTGPKTPVPFGGGELLNPILNLSF